MKITKFVGLIGGVLLAGASLAQIEPSSTELKLAPTKFDFEGQKAGGMFYMPSSVNLTTEKPSQVIKEPKYRTTPRYTTIAIGNGPNSEYVIAFDEPENGEVKMYIDFNRNGDLTDDKGSEWQTRTEHDGNIQYSGTYIFRASWGDANHETSSGKYGLNFYRSPSRDALNYYRAGARVGQIEFLGTAYEITLVENDNDALYNKPFDPKGEIYPQDKPVWLIMDGRQFDIRGTFLFNNINCMATVSDDGSKLTISPSYVVVTMPKKQEVPKELLAAGTPAPDFKVVEYGGGEINLSDYKGKVVIVDFWATWCGPCVRSMPHLERVYQQVKDQGVVVIAVNVSDDKQAYENWVTKNSDKYKFMFAYDPTGRDGPSIANRLYNVRGIPATFVIGKDGKIAGVVSGYREGDNALESLLATVGVKTKEVIPAIGMTPMKP